MAAEVSSIVAAWRVVRSLRSLAPERISPVADWIEREVVRNWPTTSAKRVTVPLRAWRRSSNSGWKAVSIVPVRSPSASCVEARADGGHGLLAGRDVGGELHDLVGHAIEPQDRAERALDPDFAAIAGAAAIFAALELAGGQIEPELAIAWRGRIGIEQEERIGPAGNIGQAIAEQLEEIVVGGDAPRR